MGVSTSRAFGEGDTRKVRLAFTQGVLTYLIMYLVVCMPTAFFSESIFVAVGMAPDNASLAAVYFRKLFLLDFLRMFGYFLMSFSASQGIEGKFALIVNINLAISLGVMWLVDKVWSLHVESFFVARLVYDLLCVLGFFFVYLKETDKRTQGFSSLKEALSENFVQYFKDCLIFSGGMYAETAGWQISNYLTGLTKNKDQLAALTCLSNVTSYIFCVGYGIASVLRTRLSNLLGKGYNTAAKNLTIIFLVGSFAYTLLQSLLICIAHDRIVSFYTGLSTKETQQYFSELLWYYCIFQISDTIFYPVFTICRSRGLAGYTMLICVVLLIGVQSVSGMTLVWLGYSCVAMLLNTYSMFIMGYIVILYMLYVIFPWELKTSDSKLVELQEKSSKGQPMQAAYEN